MKRLRNIDFDDAQRLGRRAFRAVDQLLPARRRPPPAIAAFAVAAGAFALGALAIGALAIGRMSIGRARIGRLEVDELIVNRLRVKEQLPSTEL